MTPETHDEAVEGLLLAFPGAEVVEEVVGRPCAVCGLTVAEGDPDRYNEVLGWEKAFRKQGGTNAVAARQVTGRSAHKHCVDKLKRGGVGAAQETLL